jgi:hypothetical protein
MPLKRARSTDDLKDCDKRRNRNNSIGNSKSKKEQHIIDCIESVVSQSQSQSTKPQNSHTAAASDTHEPADAQPAASTAPSVPAAPDYDVIVLEGDVKRLQTAVKTIKGNITAIRASLTCLTDDSTVSAARLLTIETQLTNELGGQTAEVERQKSEISQLKMQMRQQQDAVAGMLVQMAFILSFLSISPSDAATTATEGSGAATAASGADQPASRSAPNTVSASSGSSSSCSSRPTRQQQSAEAQQRRTAKQSFKEVVKSAIEQDNRDRARRAKSIVINGLGARDGSTDKQIVMQLLSTEYQMNADVTFCKRLGEARTGYVRPLLVALSSTEDAQWLVANAKWLRRSKDSSIKEHVYINANQTKEEARIAYEQRVRRRTTSGKETQLPSAAGHAGRSVHSNCSSTRVVVNSSRTASRNDNTDIRYRSDSRLPADNPSSPANIPASRSSTFPSASILSSTDGCTDVVTADVHLRWRPESMDTTPQLNSTSNIPTAPPISAQLVQQIGSSRTVNQQNSVDTRSSFTAYNVSAPEFTMSHRPAAAAVAADYAGSCASRSDRL